MDNELKKRIGIAILRTLAEYALKSIPVYGVYLELGIDLFNAVRNELSKEYQLNNIVDMKEPLLTVDNKEAGKIVDEVMDSPEIKKILNDIPAAQIQNLRERLIKLPSEFDQILAVLEQKENNRAYQDKVKKESEIKAEKERQQTKVKELKELLKKQLTEEKFMDAYDTTEKIIALNKSDKDVLKTQAWLDKRLGQQTISRNVTYGCLSGLGIVLLFVAVLSGQKGNDAVFILFTVIIGLGAFIGLLVGLFKKSSRWWKIKFK